MYENTFENSGKKLFNPEEILELKMKTTHDNNFHALF